MKNIHLLQTEKPSRLYENTGALVLDKLSDVSKDGISINQYLYITSDEEIKEGDWVLNISNNKIFKQDNYKPDAYTLSFWRKIILTTDQDLIKDGVQAIPDEFLEWFVKNPNCERVEVEKVKVLNYTFPRDFYTKYKIIIPKEEPKQETLEESAKNNAILELRNYKPNKERFKLSCKNSYLRGAKLQQEQDNKMYSEEEAGELVYNIIGVYAKQYGIMIDGAKLNDLFEQFKKK